MAKRTKSFCLNMSLALILLAYPLFYVGGISPDSRLHLLAFAPALLACAITIRFC